MCQNIPESFPIYSKSYKCPVDYASSFTLKKFEKQEIEQIKQSLEKLCGLGPIYNSLRTKRIIDIPNCPGYLKKRLPAMSIRAGANIRIFWNLKRRKLLFYGAEKRKDLS